MKQVVNKRHLQVSFYQKIRLLESEDNYEEAHSLISNWVENNPEQRSILRVEYLKYS